MFFEVGFERGGGAAGDVDGCFTGLGAAGVGGRHGRGRADQRRVGVLEDRDVGDRQRADGFAVVTAFEAEEIPFLVEAAVAPAVEGHLQRDLGRRSAV